MITPSWPLSFIPPFPPGRTQVSNYPHLTCDAHVLRDIHALGTASMRPASSRMGIKTCHISGSSLHNRAQQTSRSSKTIVPHFVPIMSNLEEVRPPFRGTQFPEIARQSVREEDPDRLDGTQKVIMAPVSRAWRPRAVRCSIVSRDIACMSLNEQVHRCTAR